MQELGKRDNQEDSIFPPLSDGPSGGSLFILCDGMGGHAAGEVASSTVCETMSQYIAAHPREDGLFDESDFDAALDAAYNALDAKDTEDEKKMGTTLTFAKFHAGGCFTAHIGDSRIYQVRPSEKRILHVTRDHSLVNDLITLGEMTPEEAKTSRQKNVITRAVQPHQERRTPAECLNITDVEVGDIFYLCSDGMLEQTEDDIIVNTLSLQRPLEEIIEILRGATRDNKDNHSAHLIRVEAILEEPVSAIPEAESEPAAPVGEAHIVDEFEVPVAAEEPAEPAEADEPAEPAAADEPPQEPRPKKGWLGFLACLICIAAIAFAWHPWTRKTPEASLRFVSTPVGATVWLDGECTKEVTPATMTVSSGPHRYKLVLEGYEPFEGTIEALPSGQTPVFAGLRRIPEIEPVPAPSSEDDSSEGVQEPQDDLKDILMDV